MKTIIRALLLIAAGAAAAQAKIDLVTLPSRETVQLTIYNSADLTLARESRQLTLKEGENRLEFSWANTLIDPTSLEMLFKANADKIDIADLSYPPRVRELGLWQIASGVSGKVPVEITYLTSGLSWRAFYMGTLADDEKTMHLAGYVRVTNNSGEDYENAQTRLIVGKIHLIDQIAELAQRQWPYGRPGEIPPMAPMARAAKGREEKMALGQAVMSMEMAPKQIVKEGLSEYFLYTIEGTETIPTGWSKRLPSFEAGQVPVVNLYKYEEERYGSEVRRFLSFKNDKDHNLGETPIPDGQLKVYRQVDAAGHLSYEGQSDFKYIPVDQEVELDLGAVQNVTVEPVLMDYQSDKYLFDKDGNIIGWDESRTFKIEVKNTREIPVKVEILRNFNTSSWDISENNEYEKVDKDTIKFSEELAARSEKVINYVLTTHHGTRAD